MKKQYELTWRKEQGGRWRKKYKRKEYYFSRLKGETKEASYRRCFALWQMKKSVIDSQLKTIFILDESTGNICPVNFESWKGRTIVIVPPDVRQSFFSSEIQN